MSARFLAPELAGYLDYLVLGVPLAWLPYGSSSSHAGPGSPGVPMS